MQNKPTQTLNNIQMLRAIAALLVVFHHALPHYAAMGGKIAFIGSVSEWGFLGVDIFFVISGFIMAYTTFNKERTFDNAKTFFKHRLFRIYLGYWPFFLIMLVILFVTNPQKISDLDVVGSFFLINTDMFQLVLPVSWSLSYELYFYFLFLFTFIFSIKQLYVLMPAFIALILFLVLYSFFNPEFPEHFFYSSFLLEFFAGVLLYMYKDHLMRSWMLPVSLLIVVIAYSYGITYETKNGLFRVLTFGTGALFIVLSALILEQKNFYRAGKQFEALGNASYTLYLSHLIIIQLFYLFGLRGFFSSEGVVLPLVGLFVMIALSVIFSLLYYQKIEKPVYQKAIRYKRAL